MFVQWMRGQRIAAGGVHSYTNITHPQPQSCPLQDWQPERGIDIFAMCFFIMCVRPCARGTHNLNRQNPSFCRIFSTRVCFPPSTGHGRHPQQHQDNDNNNASTTLNKGRRCNRTVHTHSLWTRTRRLGLSSLHLCLKSLGPRLGPDTMGRRIKDTLAGGKHTPCTPLSVGPGR